MYAYAAMSDFSLGDAGDSITLASTWRTYSRGPERSAENGRFCEPHGKPDRLFDEHRQTKRARTALLGEKLTKHKS